MYLFFPFSSKESLASQVVERLPMLIHSCLLSSSRTIAHKCSRLIVLCVRCVLGDFHLLEQGEEGWGGGGG